MGIRIVSIQFRSIYAVRLTFLFLRLFSDFWSRNTIIIAPSDYCTIFGMLVRIWDLRRIDYSRVIII